MALDTSKVVYGTARIFREDFDDTGALDVPDPDAQEFGDPGATWVELGLTQDGLEFRANVDYGEIQSDQLIDPVARPADSRDFGISGNMIEVTPQNINYSLGQGVVTNQAAGVGERGYDKLSLTDDVSEVLSSVLVDFENPGNGEFGRLFMPKSKPISSITSPFGNRTEAVQVAFDYAALPDTSRDPTLIADLYIYTPATEA